MKNSLIVGLILVSGLLMAPSASASYANPCQPIYGGGENCVTKGKVELDKKVQDPKSKEYVDNLSRSNTRYAPSQTINFKIVVTNTGDEKLGETTITDRIPDFVSFVSGPGDFDNASRTLTFKIFNLNPDESRSYTVTTKVVDSTNLPQNTGITCVVNHAEAISGNDFSDDNSGLCIQKVVTTATTKGGLPVMPAPVINETPATGPEMLSLLAMIPTALAGFLLRKKTSK